MTELRIDHEGTTVPTNLDDQGQRRPLGGGPLSPKVGGCREPSDEDITPLDVPADPPTVMQGPMTRARMRQLNLQVSSFLSDHFHTFENRLLPNDVILLRNIGEGQEGLRGRGGGDDDQQGRPTQAGGLAQHEFESASASRTSLL